MGTINFSVLPLPTLGGVPELALQFFRAGEQAVPKEFLRRGLLTGTEKLQGQLRDAAEGGQRQDTEIDRAQNSAHNAGRQAANRLGKLAHKKKKARDGKPGSRTDTDLGRTGPEAQIEQAGPSDSTGSVRVKTRDAASQSPPVERRSMEHRGPRPPDQGRQKFARERARNISEQQSEGRRRLDRAASAPMREAHDGNTFRQTTGTADHDPIPAPKPEGQLPRPFEQSSQKIAPERQKNAAVQQMEKQRGPEHTAPARQRDAGEVRPRHAPTRSALNEKRPVGNAARETVSDSRRQIKEARSGVKAVRRTSRKAVKGAESSGKVLKAGGRSVQTMRQTAQAAVQIRQRAVQAENAARRRATAAAAARRGAVAAVRSLVPLLAAGGGTVFAVVLVLCLVGALLASPLGIFFSGGSSGGQQQTTTTISTVVQELDQEYDARLDEIRTGASYDEESLIGSRAPWSEILAVYAVKTASDLANGQEVVTMTDGKKALLKQVFWDMNELSGFTSTVPGEGDDGEDTTTLYITVTAKTANEMSDIYGFNDDQRQQLAELLSDEYREMWNDVF